MGPGTCRESDGEDEFDGAPDAPVVGRPGAAGERPDVLTRASSWLAIAAMAEPPAITRTRTTTRIHRLRTTKTLSVRIPSKS